MNILMDSESWLIKYLGALQQKTCFSLVQWQFISIFKRMGERITSSLDLPTPDGSSPSFFYGGGCSVGGNDVADPQTSMWLMAHLTHHVLVSKTGWWKWVWGDAEGYSAAWKNSAQNCHGWDGINENLWWIWVERYVRIMDVQEHSAWSAS